MKKTIGLSGLIYVSSFTILPEYFISVSAIYILIVIVLITYNVYGLMIQRAVSECLALVLIMACYLLINDDLIAINVSSLNNSVSNDYFAFFTKFVICFSAALYFLIISNYLKQQRLIAFEYLIIVLFAVLGLVLLCSSNDFLTAYLSIELSSLALYILASFRKNSSYSVESGLKYFIIGAISSSFFLLGSSFIYLTNGSINFTDLICLYEYDQIVTNLDDEAWIIDMSLFYLSDPIDWLYYWVYYMGDHNFDYHGLALWVFGGNNFGIYELNLMYQHTNLFELGFTLILFSLFIKLGLAPFHFWTLDVYEGSPTISTFFFAVISKFSIFVLLIRICYLNLHYFKDVWIFHSLILAVLSIFVGSFGGLKTRKLKTLLAYSSTSHMGYVLLAFSAFHKFLGLEMMLFYLIIYILSGFCTWFIIINLRLKNKNFNKQNLELSSLALLSKSNSALALSFALTMFSIAGIPPLIGFLSKMGIFLVVVDNFYYFTALITILCSVISTFYYIRIIKIVYFENKLVGNLYYSINNPKVFIFSVLIFLLLFLFINPTFLYLVIQKLFYLMPYQH
jgi:NADH:ubiquinone oxidoreductase subunit 2 (subunit N)